MYFFYFLLAYIFLGLKTMSIHLDLKSLIANMLAQHMKKIVLKYQPQKLKKL